MEYVLGVDGGATKTLCVITDGKGKIVAKGKGGPSNYHVTGVKKARLSLLKAINDSLLHAGLRPGDCRFKIACFGMAGLDSRKDEEVISNLISNLHLSERNIVVHDSTIALYSATSGKPGVILIAGTGAVAAGKNRMGIMARAGNWGHIIGDEGSAYYIGREALARVIRAYDGRGSPTILMEHVKKYFHLSVMEDIMGKIYVKGTNVTKIAGLAPLVVKAAKSGDDASLEILHRAGKELGLMATAVIRRLSMEREAFDVALTGGIFKAGDLVIEPVKNEILRVAPKARIIKSKNEPVMGAIFLAFEKLRSSE